jgi:uncharacterized membrane protein
MLTAVSSSIVLCVLALRAPNLARFGAANELPPAFRAQALVAALVLAGLVAALTTLAAAKGRSALLDDWASALSPLLILAVVPVLWSRPAWSSATLEFLILCGVTTILLEVLLRRSLRSRPTSAIVAPIRAALARLPERARRLLPWLLLTAGILYYAIAISHFTLLNHERMATSSSDLAEFDNLFFNALHGHPFRSPAIEGELQNWSALKVHAEFALYLLLPFYALSPGPQALLILQTSIIALTAIPIHLFAARRLGAGVGVVFAVVYLFLPAVQQPNFYDFHFTPVGMFFVAWTFVFLDRVLHPELGVAPRRLRLHKLLLILCFAGALLSREDIAFGLSLLGLMVVLGGKSPRLGLALAASAAAYFVLMKFGVMPRFGSMWFSAIYEDLKAPGLGGFGAVVQTLLTNPAYVLRKLLAEPKLTYLLHLLVPLAFLWVRRPWLALAALPGLPFSLLVTNRSPMSEISFQYVYHWVPYIVAASVLGLQATSRRLGPGASREPTVSGRVAACAALCALIFAAALSSHQFGALLGAESITGGFGPKSLRISDEERARVARLRQLTARIPKDASVVASEREGPHVSTRLVMYSLKFTFGQDPDYVLIGRELSRAEHDRLLPELASGRYGLLASEGEFFLLQRGADPSQNANLMRWLR